MLTVSFSSVCLRWLDVDVLQFRRALKHFCLIDWDFEASAPTDALIIVCCRNLLSTSTSIFVECERPSAVACQYWCQAPRYLTNHLTSASDITFWLCLCSVNWQQLLVPRRWLDMYGLWAFSVARPTLWNLLPDKLRDPTRSSDSFKVSANVTSTLEILWATCSTYLLAIAIGIWYDVSAVTVDMNSEWSDSV